MTKDIQSSISLSLHYRWQFLGGVQIDSAGDLVFPRMLRAPGIYRFRLSANGDARQYVGETDNLQRRFQHYRKPGPSQATNIRLNKLIRDHLTTGGTVDIDTAAAEGVVTAGQTIAADLSDKTTRRLFEHAALLVEGNAGVSLLNR